MKLNGNFRNLTPTYLFSEVAERAAAWQREHPGEKLLRLSVGDVTQPLPKVASDALHRVAEELSHSGSFHGYSPCGGYPELREAVCGLYQRQGIPLSPHEVFISDGSKSDCGNLSDLFSEDNTVLIPDPVYPVYADSSKMAGRRILFLDATAENGFLPSPKGCPKADIVYLCSPNNPTGATYLKEGLQAWVDYCISADAVLLFDAAYRAYAAEAPFSVYEAEGAKQCAVEICSFSKTAGFTGVRCGYTIVPDELVREGLSLNKLWDRRQAVKFNGASYPAQMAALALFTEEGERQIQQQIAYYRKNAETIAQCLTGLHIPFTGGGPYLWMECPFRMTSWQFFDCLLDRTGVIGTPGSGFGRNGEGYFRLTAFASHGETEEACERLSAFVRNF